MADILDQKEEVINIELTRDGKKKLSLGIFQPRYYSFFDDSILYDFSYAGSEEEDNDIQSRIFDKSLTFRMLNLSTDTLRDKLGTSDIMSEFAPAWSIDILHGKINYNQLNSSYYRKRFDVGNIRYLLEITDINELPKVTSDYLLLDISEINVSDDISNFEIELFTYDELTGGKTAGLSRKLNFTDKKTNIIDDIIYDSFELPTDYYSIKVDNNDVSYYFDVLVDEEIDTDFISTKEKTIQEKRKGTYQTDYTGPVDPKC